MVCTAPISRSIESLVDEPVNWQALTLGQDVAATRRAQVGNAAWRDFVSERESMPYDVVIVGAGPAGLAAAIRLKQRADDAGRELSVCILEKGSEIGREHV